MFPPLGGVLQTFGSSSSMFTGLKQSRVIVALGTMQIMVGLFNIGLGPGRTSTHPGDLLNLGAAYWLGGVFIAAGVVSLFADQCAARCLVGFAVFVNIVSSILAVVGMVLYSRDLADASVLWLCDFEISHDNCRLVALIARRLLTAMDVTLIVLAGLQLCVSISSAVLGIEALIHRRTEKDVRDVEIYQPVSKDVLVTSPGA
ncbi:membrane-spanning 4-domains subfamily A member 4A-like [Embiotoca jacksoni]|uniref:membrane-spanning 4-domains subfamily A member 4A-like n=1 Tax=Embiotoca jacksoni TaxID=100190 RepID=UPI00370459A5